jgi:hypothetical protein
MYFQMDLCAKFSANATMHAQPNSCKNRNKSCRKSPAQNVEFTRVSDDVMELLVVADATSIYEGFTQWDVVTWLKGLEFANAEFARESGGLLRVTLHAHEQYPNSRTVAWADIACEPASSNIKHRCSVGGRDKVFFKPARNLLHYIQKLKAGAVSRAVHIRLWDLILSTFAG